MRKTLALVLLAIFFPALASAESRTDQQKLVERLAKQLRSRDVSERIDAAEWLGKVGIPEAVDPLAAALADQDPRVRRAAASALWKASKVAKPAIPALRTAVMDADPAVAVRAAGALISMDVPEKELAEPLRLVLQRGDASDRFLAARALIGIDPADKLATPMVDYLRKEAPDSSKHSADAASARRDNFEMGQKALRKLAKTKDRSMIAPLMSQLPQSPLVARPILEALGEFQPPPDRWIDALLVQLDASDPGVRYTAVELLGKQKAKAADVTMWVMPVARSVSDADSSVRSAALRALKGAGGLALAGLDAVLQGVSSERDADLRARAAEVVGEIANAEFPVEAGLKSAAAKKALPVLTAAAEKDAESDVRRNAVHALNQLQLEPETVVPLLARIAVAQKDNEKVRWAALLALRNRGREAASATEAIRPLVNDPNESVRRDAKAAIESFGSSYSGKKAVAQTKAGDPAAREKALAYLRENNLGFTEDQFYRALREVDIEKVTAFLDGGMSANLRFANAYGDPVLRVSVESAEACHPKVRPTAAATKAIVKLLLARRADAKLADDRGNTALMEAVEKCDADVVKMLLKAGSDMNAKNGSGMTAFEFGLIYASDGAAAMVAAGYRLPAGKATTLREAYKKNPKIVELIDKASKTGPK